MFLQFLCLIWTEKHGSEKGLNTESKNPQESHKNLNINTCDLRRTRRTTCVHSFLNYVHVYCIQASICRSISVKLSIYPVSPLSPLKFLSYVNSCDNVFLAVPGMSNGFLRRYTRQYYGHRDPGPPGPPSVGYLSYNGVMYRAHKC